MVTGVIMASGLSRRMGENKLLMNYNNTTIIENVIREVSKISFYELIVVSQYEEILELSSKYGFKPVYNKNAHLGQSESIKLGILNSSKCDGYMFFVGDQPLIKSEDINKIINVFREDKDYIVIPKYKNTKGNPVIFPYNKKDELLRLKDDEKGKKVVKDSKNIKYIDVSGEMLFDIDTPEDFNKLLSLKK